MAAFAVQQYQGVIRGQATQVGGPDDTGGVTDGLGVNVKGGNYAANEVSHVTAALIAEVITGDYVNRRG